MRFELPDGTAPVDGADWFGLGPLESYPDSLRAARTGRFSGGVRDLAVAYARPQETGHRSRMRRLTLTSGGTEVLRLVALPDTRGRRPGFTLGRHTPEQIARAAHPFELPESTTSHLIIDAVQHGLGSRSCGPDVWPEFVLRPEARTIRLRITPGAWRPGWWSARRTHATAWAAGVPHRAGGGDRGACVPDARGEHPSVLPGAPAARGPRPVRRGPAHPQPLGAERAAPPALTDLG